jgi:hypothetical protein
MAAPPPGDGGGGDDTAPAGAHERHARACARRGAHACSPATQRRGPSTRAPPNRGPTSPCVHTRRRRSKPEAQRRRRGAGGARALVHRRAGVAGGHRRARRGLQVSARRQPPACSVGPRLQRSAVHPALAQNCGPLTTSFGRHHVPPQPPQPPPNPRALSSLPRHRAARPRRRSEALTGSIEDVSRSWGISQSFLGWVTWRRPVRGPMHIHARWDGARCHEPRGCLRHVLA